MCVLILVAFNLSRLPDSFSASAYDYVVKPHGKELVKTDLAIHVPEGTYGRVAPRSGLAVKSFIDVGGQFLAWSNLNSSAFC